MWKIQSTHYREKAIRIISFSEPNLILSLCSNLSTYLSSMMSLNHRYSLLFISGHASLRASSPIWASETSIARARGKATRGREKESLQRSLIKFHLYFTQTKGDTIGWKMTFRKSKLIDNRPSRHPLRLCVKFGSQGDQIGTENLFQPSMQTGSLDVILAKRILRAQDKSHRVCKFLWKPFISCIHLCQAHCLILKTGRVKVKSDSSTVFQHQFHRLMELYWVEKFRNMYLTV